MRKLIPYVVVTGGILGAFLVACGSDATGLPTIDPGDLQDTDAAAPGTPEPGKDSGTHPANDAGADAGPTTPPTPTDFAIGGTVTGLKGTGMVLQNNGGDDLSVNADGTFVFKNKLAKGKPFAVTVKTQPTAPAQTCTVSGGTGTVASANVTTVAINCATDTFTIGGSVSGLAGTGLVLQNNAGDDATIAADGSFAFATPVADGGDYAVTVKTQPTGLSQTCTVTSDKGTVAGKNVTDVAVTCVTNKFTVGGTVAGLKGTGLSLKNNAGDDLAVAADGTFTFATSLNDGSDFAVTVGASPTGPTQTCTVSGGTGKIAGGNVTTVTVNCSTETYAVGGTVSGLAGTGLVLQNNAGNDLAVNANGTFAFATPVTDLGAYAVTVKTQPTGKWQTCTVASGSGNVAGAPVTNVAITCTTNGYKVKGTVSDLAGTGLVLQNNAGDDLAINANGTFEFATSVASGGTYLVTTLTNPTNMTQTCAVSNGTGTIAGADVTDVAVTCTPLPPASCMAIKQATPAATDGTYVIDPDGAGPLGALSVWCDMTTDGGGYTSYAVTGGISTTRFDQANSCTALGLQLAIPRTQAHLNALFAKYGKGYFKVVPGVYGLAKGDYRGCAMNSTDATCSANWKALDGGQWFAKNAAYSEPNGDYTPGCWLGLDNNGVDASGFVRFNDANCGYQTGTSYVCSDNIKGSVPYCGTAGEGGTTTVTCPAGTVIKNIDYASYGTPNGTCGGFTDSACDAATSQSKVEAACLGKSTCSVGANNGVFGDPCGGVTKRLYIQATCQ